MVAPPIFNVGIGESVENLKPIKELFIAPAQEKKILDGRLDRLKEIFASWHIISFVARQFLEHLMPIYFKNSSDSCCNRFLCAPSANVASLKTFTQHEGTTIDFEQVDFGRTQNAEAQAVSVELRFDEIPSLVGEALEKKMRLLADQSGALKMKSMFAKIHEATEQTGNKLDAKGKPIDGRMLLDMIDMAEGAFDRTGKPTNSFLVHPNMVPSLKKASDELTGRALVGTNLTRSIPPDKFFFAPK